MLSIVHEKIPQPDCVLLCFDSSRQILDLMKIWIPKIEEVFSMKMKNVYLVATKIEQMDDLVVRDVKKEVVQVFGKRFLKKLYFVSSATEKNVKKLFDETLIETLNRKIEPAMRERSWTMKLLQGLCSN